MSGLQDQPGRYGEPRSALIDANVYAALVLQEHKGHATAHRWLARQPQIATCPMVELAVLRLLMRPIEAGGCGLSAGKARSVVVRFKQATSVKMIPEDVEASSDALPWRHVLGHNQVNDAYLLALARIHQLRVCTFDRGFMSLFPGSSSESVELLAYDAG